MVEVWLSIVRPFMRNSIQKLKPFPKGRKNWVKAVRRHIDPIVLPYRYGGYSKATRRKYSLGPGPDDS